jgi:hypothetical protein
MEILLCVCPDGGDTCTQLLRSGLFPATFKQIETLFTVSVLEDFLTDNLECKTTAQQYYSKLQIITNKMFPNNVPVCLSSIPTPRSNHILQNRYKQLLRVSRQWQDLKNRMESGLGHNKEGEAIPDGSMAVFCPACPQPGINLLKDWKTKYTPYVITLHFCVCQPILAIREQLIRTFIMDGNFSAEHMKQWSGERDVSLSAGMAFMANPDSYKAHLRSGQETVQVCLKYFLDCQG